MTVCKESPIHMFIVKSAYEKQREGEKGSTCKYA